MGWAKTFRLPYYLCHIFNSRTVEQSETWFKPKRKNRNELEYLINVSNLSKLLKHLTVKNVCSVWSWSLRVFLLPLYQPAGLFLLLPQKRTAPPLQTWSFGNWGISLGEYPRIFPSFSWGIFSHVTRLDQSRASENIWWIIKWCIFQWMTQAYSVKENQSAPIRSRT